MNKFEDIMERWKAHDDWQFADREVAWRHFFNAGVAAATPQGDTIPISKDDLNSIYEILATVNTDDEGRLFICEEAADLFYEVRNIVKQLL